MKSRIATLLVVTLLTSTLPVEAQVMGLPSGGGEKKPTTRSPDYRPPYLPDYMKKKLQASEEFMLSPLLSGDEDEFGSMVEKQLQRQSSEESKNARYEYRTFSASADTPADRRRFERDILTQFGVDYFDYRTDYQPEHYHESAGRRFQIVFMLSLPITLLFSYGIAALAKNSGRGGVSLNGPETAAFVSAGLLGAGAIAWYDLRQWQALPEEHSSLNRYDRKREELEELARIKSLLRPENDRFAFQPHFGFTTAF